VSKEARRQRAQKKAQQRRNFSIAIAVVIGLIIVGGLVYEALRADTERVFESVGGSHVTLRDDGTFAAHLPHNLRFNGTFTETQSGDITTVAFTHSGGTHNGIIRGRGMSLPPQWDSGCCGSGLTYRLR
jgi:hypothetical protein